MKLTSVEYIFAVKWKLTHNVVEITTILLQSTVPIQFKVIFLNYRVPIEYKVIFFKYVWKKLAYDRKM